MPDPALNGPIFNARAVTKSYDGGQVQALRGVDFQIEKGEYVAITGPSGCGKTTLLQLLGALDEPTGGEILYRGQSLAALPSPARYRSHEIGFVFQAFHLLPTFTAIENVQMPMFEAGESGGARLARAKELLASVGLASRENHFPSKLSGGERQRVAIARSLANRPTVLLADEPTGNLDSQNAALILDLLTQIHRDQGLTLVLITHDRGIAESAPRVLQMKDGRVLSDERRSSVPA